MKTKIMALLTIIAILMQILAMPTYAILENLEEQEGVEEHKELLEQEREDKDSQEQEKEKEDKDLQKQEKEEDKDSQEQETEGDKDLEEQETEEKYESYENLDEKRIFTNYENPENAQEEEINIPDENLKAILLREHDIDDNGIITETDLIDIEYLYIDNVSDYTGLEYATNLTNLNLNNYGINGKYDLSFLRNIKKLTDLSLYSIDEIDNLDVINEIQSLKRVSLNFNNKSEVDKLIVLEENKNLFLEIGTNYYDNNSDEEIRLIAEKIANLNVKQIYYRDLYRNKTISKPVIRGEIVTYTFDEINPFLEEFILNENSKFYNPYLNLRTYENSVTIDEKNKTITIDYNTDKDTIDTSFYIEYTYYEEEYSTWSANFGINRKTIEQGNTSDEIEIPDKKLKEILLSNYDIDKNGIITEIDLINIEYLSIYDVSDLTGVEYATNLKQFSLSKYDGNHKINLNFLRNMNKLTSLNLYGIDEIVNLDIINEIQTLTSVCLSFNNKSEVDKLIALKENKNLFLEISTNNYDNNSDDEIRTIAEKIANLNVKKIYYRDLYRNKTISEPVMNGETVTYTFDEINPFLEEFILNENSKFYNPHLDLMTYDNNVKVDVENKTITINYNSDGNTTFYIGYTYYRDDNSGWGASFGISRNVIRQGDTENEIDIPDKNLKDALLKDYDIDKNGKITEIDLINIESLSLNNISDLTGLEYTTNLKYLNLSSLKTDNISPIANLTNLTNLNLSFYGSKKIKNIAQLQNLTNLTQLYIYSSSNNNNDDGIEDISILANLKKLQYVSISGHSIKDISPLKNLENLYSLSFDNNKIDDISQLLEFKSIDKLNNINLSRNNISDISQLRNIMNKLKNIRYFYLSDNCIDDLNSIKELETLANYSAIRITSLRYTIDLGKIERYSEQKIALPKTLKQVEETFNELEWNTNVSSNEWMENLEDNLDGEIYNLDTSYIGKQQISIDKYGQDKQHNYSQNKISSVNVIIKFQIEATGDKEKIITFKDENLNKVISENYDLDNDGKITEYDILNLTILLAPDCNIKDLTGIEQATNLRDIEVYNNKIRDISPLMKLKDLTFAELYGNEITDITCLKDRTFKYTYAIGYENNYIDFSNNSENTKTFLTEWQKDIDKYGNIAYGSGKELLCSFASTQKYGHPDDANKIVNMDDKIRKAIIEQLHADTNNDGQLSRKELYNVPQWRYDNENHTSNENKLNLSNLNLTNISGIEYLSNISILDISNNQIYNIEPLTHLYNLDDLDASNNRIESIDMLPYYKSNYTTKYNFSNNKISDISCLINWRTCYSTIWMGWRAGGDPNFRNCEFDFSNNNIKDISVVKEIRTLAYMNLNNNKITDISPLKDYDFVINPEEMYYQEDEYLYEELEDFKGISLKGNEIDPNNSGNKAAIDVFKNKGVKLVIDANFEQITIKDDKTNIQITTLGEDTAKIQVEEIEKESTEYKEISEQLEDMEIVSAVEISIIDGEYSGKIHLTIPVDEKYNNKFVKVLHKKSNGKVEEFIRKVTDASVSIDVDELSPFYIAFSDNLLPKGDINGDGKVNTKDWNMMYEYINETRELTEDEFKRGDINNDGKVNVKDWNRMYEHITEVNPLW